MPATSQKSMQGAEVVKRSTLVTVLAWIFICFSGIAFLLSLLQIIMIATLPAAVVHADMHPLFEQKLPAVFRFLFTHPLLFSGIFFALIAVLLASSVGLLLRKNWARVLFIAMMALGTLWNLIGLALQAILFSEMPASLTGAGRIGGMPAGVGIISSLIEISLCALFGWIIRTLTLPAVRREFPRASRPDR